MAQIAALLDVVERFYAATLAPGEWPKAMATLQRMLGGQHVVLRVLDATSGGLDFTATSGLLDRFRETCVGRVHFNPPSRMEWRVKVNPPYAGFTESIY